MERKAALADGVRPGIPIASPSAVRRVVALQADAEGSWELGRRDAWTVLRAGLLRDLCGARLAEIAADGDCTPSAAHTRVRLHRSLVLEDPIYLQRAAMAARGALDAWRKLEESV